MKFRDGYWGIQKNVKMINKVEIQDSKAENGCLTVYASPKRIVGRGDTLNTPLHTLEFSSPLENVIHVRSYHFKGALHTGPQFELAPDKPEQLQFSQSEEGWEAISDQLSVSVGKKGPCSVAFSYAGRELTASIGSLSGHATVDGDQAYQCEYLSLGVGETIYGLGERFTPFVKNGQVVDIWNEDGGTSSEQAYKNIPFYLSSKGYGVLVSDPGKVSFEVGSEVVTAVQFSVKGECLDYYLIGGETLKQVLASYSLLCGKPALPPPWSFGLWLSTSFTTDYDETTVNGFLDGMTKRNIPLQVFHFDCFWMKEFQWVDFVWDERQFPDPVAMIKRMHAKGLHVCVWINPYIAQKSVLFDEGMAKGYLVKKQDGSVWQWDRWQAGMALVDFTNREAVSWFQSKLQKLLDMGVDTFKTDFGERIPTEVVYHDQSDPLKMHNFYTYLYNKAVFELVEKNRGVHEALVFARSATVGGQKFPVHWGGDCSATYASMAESLRGGLSLSLSGFGFWSHDIGGFEKTATPDLFKRWVAFGLLSSHSRLHGSESYRVPWNYDDQASEVLRHFVELKCSLMPYLFGQAVKTHQTGVPMMRSMVLEYPEDPCCAYLDRQYLLGDSLLVAPVFSSDGIVSYYLPQGVWTNFLNGRQVEGGRWYNEHHDYFSLPLMVRPNSLLAVGNDITRTDYDFSDGVCFHVFALDDGNSISVGVSDHEGKEVVTCTVSRSGSTYEVVKTGKKTPWSVCLRGIEKIGSNSAGVVAEGNLGCTVTLGPQEETVVVIDLNGTSLQR
ncbi:family 31 glycosyl hydrolase, alpha-glucosidase [Sphaerochaeta pleomorpha str. Grapes]|uniref:alpha-D-xyloside xylohydrolase n=1 Tax=Sphaerochaeta pleomorpha (strain ATCC BAA-1885 / DSM 22778 / Grapes) TaxID=158190 RepID=G8QWB0_SPHPG|nr:alpha-xylosidase [Sphaerochaeta pleomorpha]AEV29408.1 family 31 glycosyl hydrolase, alpha-glucosidase [Sphaerochaeta pleomorpha str. Grapes]